MRRATKNPSQLPADTQLRISVERETGVEPATFSLASISSLALCGRDQRGHLSVSAYMLTAAPFKGHFPGDSASPR